MSPLHLRQAQTSIVISLSDSTPTQWLTLFQFRLLNRSDYHLVLNLSISISRLFLKVLVKLDPKPMGSTT